MWVGDRARVAPQTEVVFSNAVALLVMLAMSARQRRHQQHCGFVTSWCTTAGPVVNTGRQAVAPAIHIKCCRGRPAVSP